MSTTPIRPPDDDRVRVVDDVGPAVGRRWQDLQEQVARCDRDFWVSAPLSATPLPVYRWLIAHAGGISGWNRMRFVLMDEQLDGVDTSNLAYVASTDPASYTGFALRNFLEPLRHEVELDQQALIIPGLDDLSGFGHMIDRRGGLDLVILALGVGGNYANVMPGTGINTGWHVTKLTDEYRDVHTRPGSASYEGARFRHHGMSLGPQQILRAAAVIVVVSGGHKSALFRRLTERQEFDADFPLSVIHAPAVRERVTLIITPDVLGIPDERAVVAR